MKFSIVTAEKKNLCILHGQVSVMGMSQISEARKQDF